MKKILTVLLLCGCALGLQAQSLTFVAKNDQLTLPAGKPLALEEVKEYIEAAGYKGEVRAVLYQSCTAGFACDLREVLKEATGSDPVFIIPFAQADYLPPGDHLRVGYLSSISDMELVFGPAFPYDEVAVKPTYNGGDLENFRKALLKYWNYELEGSYTLHFSVDAAGKVYDVTVPGASEEDAGCFMDAIGYAAALWTPGRDAAGSPINTACTLQFEF